jgi:hypothetical protein
MPFSGFSGYAINSKYNVKFEKKLIKHDKIKNNINGKKLIKNLLYFVNKSSGEVNNLYAIKE